MFILSALILSANTYPHFDKKDFLYIQKTNGKIAKNRALDYQEKIREFKKFPREAQLTKVNFYLNQLQPQYDDVIQGEEDYWATPKEFISCGYGDCEDYVIIKYFTLIKLGFDKKKLYLTTVYEKYTGSYHMVLSYFKTKKKAPLILDNLSFRILDLKTRKDLEAISFINEYGVYKLNNKDELTKSKTTSLKFKNLLLKIEKEKEN